jgi:hypothetical protein
MNEENFNISIRKFLKMVGVSSQREIEQAVAKALASGGVAGDAHLPATMTLDIPASPQRQVRRRDPPRLMAVRRGPARTA